MMKFITIASILVLMQRVTIGQEAPRFESETNLVPIDVQVVDRDTRQPIPGLARDDLIVLDDGKPARLGLFDGSFVPLDLVLLIDMSGGIQNEGKLFTTDAFLRLREPQDRMALISFNEGPPKRRVDLTESQSELVDARHALFRIDSDDAGHRAKNSRLYDAILEGIRTYVPYATARNRSHHAQPRSSFFGQKIVCHRRPFGLQDHS